MMPGLRYIIITSMYVNITQTIFCHAMVLYAYRVMLLHVYHEVVIVDEGTSHVYHVRVYNGHVFTLFDDGSHIRRNMIH